MTGVARCKFGTYVRFCRQILLLRSGFPGYALPMTTKPTTRPAKRPISSLQVKNLKPNPKNPRTITDAKLDMLRKALVEFGDLGGIVFNCKTKKLVGGHQRVKALPPNALVTLERTYRKPTRTGTTAEGFIEIEGERFKYREVSWDETREKAAAIAANHNAGEWDNETLLSWLSDIEELGIDTDLTMFEDYEIDALKPKSPKKAAAKDDDDGGDDDGPKEKKRVVCPECNHRFVPGWT